MARRAISPECGYRIFRLPLPMAHTSISQNFPAAASFTFIRAPAGQDRRCRPAGMRFRARGCTPQSCGFRDHFAEFKQLGVDALYGLSTQDSAYQREAAERLHLPFAILSDAELKLTRAMRLPTFVVDGMTLIKRMAWVIDAGVVSHVFYPVFPPERSAADVVAWLAQQRP
jgi:peroxiredoxin